MASLCIIVNKIPMRKNQMLKISAVISLLSYFFLWGFYFNGIANGVMLTGMAAFPSLFFLLIAWKLRNTLACSFTLLFAFTHISITASNFLF
ncbi:MAG: hypothetical protein ACLRPU_21375, partial [Enterococcus hulanensis]